MSFDVSIYNADCRDPSTLLNSVKAAYLYGDKVKVYDRVSLEMTGSIWLLESEINSIINSGIEYISELQPQDRSEILLLKTSVINLWKKKKVLEKVLMPHDGDMYTKLLHAINILSILDPVNYSENVPSWLERSFVFGEERAEYRKNREKQKSTFELKKANLYATTISSYLDYYNMMGNLRRQIDPNYNEYRYLVDLIRLNVDLVQSEIFIEDDKIHMPYIEKEFIEDGGFKIFNTATTFSSSHDTMTPSMIVPSYLSEYSLSMLPGFEEATVDEIIDIRKELDKYIIPYRAAMLRMAKEIKDISDTESLKRECMILYLREIEPQVASINAAIMDNNVFKNIAKGIVTDEKTWASMGALATAFITTGDIANAVSVGAAITFGGLSIAKSVVSSLEEEKKIKDNEMFFLYQAGKRLKNTKKDIGNCFIY